jgi:uncharacterized protein with PIN domain
VRGESRALAVELTVAVPCSKCGLEYDVALFAFGRTIFCNCGSRVGMAPRVRELGDKESRFFADAMLGRLARWLRILGLDTAWEAQIPDGELARRAFEEERVVLTRDRSFPDEWRVSSVYLVEAILPLEQLREVARHFDLGGELDLFTRCSRCNSPLEPASKAAAQGSVPPRVWVAQTRFQRCPSCERFYWSGSHTDRMRDVIAELVAS